MNKILSLAALLFFLSASGLYGQQIDILIKGGHVIDPKNQIDRVMDVAITEGRIYRVAQSIPAESADRVVDAAGLYVTPGLIDMHTHIFHGTEEVGYQGFEIANSYGSIPPDGFTFRAGVTTAVDAGSSGWRNFNQFRKQTIGNSRTRVLAFLSVTGLGMLGTIHSQDTGDMDPNLIAFTVNEHKDVVVGVKVHHFQGPDFTQVERAVEAGTIADVPVIVDFGGTLPPLSIEELFMEQLRPGDIFTHTFAYSMPRRESIVDEDGTLKSFVFNAQERGIVFDVGHGAGAFVWQVAKPALEQGFTPDVISTDLYERSMNAGMKDMSNVMSKFLNLGMSLQDVIQRATWNPARVISRTELGHLSVGAEADVAVFNLREGDFGFVDARGYRIDGNRKLEAELTLRAGDVVWDLNGIAAPVWGD